MPGPGPYTSWPDDEDARWVRAASMFGQHLMSAARDYAFGRIPDRATPEQRQMAERAALDAIYGVLMLLDGVSDSRIDSIHRAEYVLSMRVLAAAEDVPAEQFELAPDGDGLCMGFHGWVKGSFGD